MRHFVESIIAFFRIKNMDFHNTIFDVAQDASQVSSAHADEKYYRNRHVSFELCVTFNARTHFVTFEICI